MCQKVIYKFNNNFCMVAFNQYLAKLPVLLRDGSQKLFTWGRHKNVKSALPFGSSVYLDDILSGRWDKYFPKPVQLPIRSFLVRDIDDNAKWFHLPSDKCVQGMLVNDDQRIMGYVVALSQNSGSLLSRRTNTIVYCFKGLYLYLAE